MKRIKELFIKDWQSVDKVGVRLRYGVVASVIGIIINSLLFGIKLLAGILSNSVTVIADALNNLSDFGSSTVTLFGFRMSSRPADKEHPYGHARFEYITALIVAFVVIAIGLMLAKTSIEKIIKPEDISPSVITYVVLGVSILAKLFQMAVYGNFGKSIKSSALVACATDSRNDIVATAVVLVATIVMQTTEYNIDGYAGLAVSIFIIISGCGLVKETIDPLLGTVPDKELVNKIREKLMSYDGVLGVHDMMIHNYGASQIFAVAHAEVSADSDFLECHDMIDEIEREFYEEMNVHMCIHMDPVRQNDNKTNEMKARIEQALKSLNGEITLHDFRVVEGHTHTNVLFDVVLPYELEITVEEIKSCSKEALDGDTDYRFVVNIDRSFVS